MSGGARVSAGGARVGGGFSAAPRAAVTGSFNRGTTFAGRTGTFAGRTGTFAGRTGTFAGRTGTFAGRTGGHWGWRHGRRHFFPFGAVAAGVGVGLALDGPSYYDDDCVAWNGWQYVNVCYYPD
jgi:hypothetical protein